MNQSQKLFEEAGQSVWYDNIQRKLLKNGEMARMISQGEIRGVTSNPSIFMNAITKSQDYDESLIPVAKTGASPTQIFFQLAIEDIQATADLFRALYDQTSGGDGFVSLEVSPYLAHDTAGTLEEARRLWKRVDRPNLMIKIPATKAGLPAITEALAEGINVNVTLIFSRERYAEVMEAHLSGLEKHLAKGLPIDRVASVASFFVSRVDTNVDPRLQAMVDCQDPQAAVARQLLGKAAIANARLAYADFKAFTKNERFQKIKASGGRPQRPLWASTSTKNPAYRDVIYVEELVGPDTVNTMPPQTLVAFLEHGQVRPGSLEEKVTEAHQALDALEGLGISMKAVTQQLEDEGVKSFSDAFTALLEAVEKRSQAAVAG
jgi:transaldolase